jgi:hypothetical protein
MNTNSTSVLTSIVPPVIIVPQENESRFPRSAGAGLFVKYASRFLKSMLFSGNTITIASSGLATLGALCKMGKELFQLFFMRDPKLETRDPEPVTRDARPAIMTISYEN